MQLDFLLKLQETDHDRLDYVHNSIPTSENDSVRYLHQDIYFII